MRPVVVDNSLDVEVDTRRREDGLRKAHDDLNALLEEVANLQTLAYLLNANSRIPEFPEE
jgi:hypothetical protein